jgi:hypothetical protein
MSRSAHKSHLLGCFVALRADVLRVLLLTRLALVQYELPLSVRKACYLLAKLVMWYTEYSNDVVLTREEHIYYSCIAVCAVDK